VAEATTTSERVLVGTLFTLTYVCGLIDAASFLALGHVFTANMTGNVVFMAFAVAGVPELSIVRSALALTCALAGAVIAGHLDTRLTWKKRPTWFAAACILEALFLGAATIAAWFGREHLQEQSMLCVIIALTALGMGVRNGTVRRLAVPDLTTTVLTLTVAGIGFDSSLAGGKNPRWQIRIASICLMFAGAATGALILKQSLILLLLVATFLTTCCAVVQIFRDETAHEAKLNIR
jgi:uncharacterized membrane protein YoaK (UPF0700 family)